MKPRITTYAPREHSDLLADAMGEGYDAEQARQYAGGPLRRMVSHEDDNETEEPEPR